LITLTARYYFHSKRVTLPIKFLTFY